ncbi:WD repeat and FYVE domain-containing protein 3-like, partial [Amphibalanus amphitrite]|uniref:WD repeat and FYVE domain-containing protein 3-like n=1 Tax=Amphibalanus amphitrite TaxID=1232801 RepID=UPI001C91EAF2
MNIMKKFWGSGGSAPEDAVMSQQIALSLTHLRKLYAEYVRPPQPLTEPEREAKLYSMLPLFCKVFAGSSGQEIWDRFPQCVQLSEFATKLMVTEIRRRAFNENTALASCEIISYLEMGSAEESSNGWMLLNTLNLLSSAGPTVVQSMVAAALPSTLVKCLYLFFDLPELGTDVAAGTEITPQESRNLLQKVFVQLMSRLCTSPCAADELARRDDLSLLFSAMTSSCPAHNVSWRKSASEVLMGLSRSGLSQNTINYIHNNGCVSLCVDNMRAADDLPPLETVEMFVSLFCFLKDSADVSQVLLADLRSSQGYIFLGEFLLKLEQDLAPESTDAARNLVLLLASLAMCGHTELQPSQAAAGTPFKLSGFSVPQPSGLGTSVRNVHAFQVLQTVFLRATSSSLCCVILDTISSVYHADRANYFILESQHTISQFAEKIHQKPKEAQDKFFQLLELVVFQLNYVPVKELISCSILLKQHCSVDCSLRCMESLLSILRFSPLFKDVYREVGILEVLVQCLARYADILKSRRQTEEDGDEYDLPGPQSALGRRTMETFTVLLAGSAANAAVFRESGGSQRVHEMLVYPDCSQQALGILQQLMLCAGGESEMGSLLALMENASFSQIGLKIDILKCVLACLRDSHRSRTMFRRVGGFVYVMAVLVSLEGCMAETPEPPWDSVPRQTMLSLVHGAFNTLTMAMRYEPANAKFFQLEICSTSLLDTVRLLGCFGGGYQLAPIDFSYEHTEEHTFQSIFASDVTSGSLPPNVPISLSYACLTLRLLYDMALDSFDKPAMAAAVSSGGARRQEEQQESAGTGKRRAPTGLNLSPPPPEPMIVHAGVVVELLHLLPAIHHPQQRQMAVTLQVYLAEILKSLMRSERNQQVMCDAGFPCELLSTCRLALEDEDHLLHPAIQYMLERLAAQTLEPRDLRSFLRLGNPLMCAPVDEPPTPDSGGPVSLTRVKTLVSMTTPRDCRHGGAAILPPFVEFDMSVEGFGCLFLPSLAPQCLSVGDTSVLGGIGTGDRVFPPATGLTYSTWFNVERYSNSRADPHCVRLLTLVRHPHGRDQQLICLTVVLSARDKALIISTRETEMPHHGAYDWEPDCRGDTSLRVWCPDLLEENQWHHLLVTLNRAVLKHSACAVYIDGKQVANQKLHYVSQNPGGGAANLTSSAAVYGFIGTPPQWRRHSKLVWKQGACLLVEEALPPAVVGTVYRLGPNYLGTLQAPFINGECCSALIPEERVMLGLNAVATSQLTLAKIRKVYSKADNRSIAKQLGMSSHENATPIRILHNAGGHLSGPARTLGGVVIGYLGVRVFCARPVARMVENVGSTSLVLGLIAMAADVEGLYAGVKALTCVVKTNKA